MKHLINSKTLIATIILIFSSATFYIGTDLSEQKEVKKALISFAKAGDNQNVAALESL